MADIATEEDEDRSLAPVYTKEDAASILSSIRHEKKLLHAKRRWLMGLPENVKVSKRCLNSLRSQTFFADMFLPESFVRDNDVFDEEARTYLRKCFSAFGEGGRNRLGAEEIVCPLSTNGAECEAWRGCRAWRIFISMLDDLNINALRQLVDIVAPQTSDFEKTRAHLKSVIKRYLPMVFKTNGSIQKSVDLKNQITELFRNPNSFRESSLLILNRSSSTYYAASEMILQKLDQFPIWALDAMRRKLRKSPCSLKVQPFSYRKNVLIGMLTKRLEKLRLKTDGESVELITKAFRVASLSMKLINRCFESPFPEISQLPPKVVELQNEILKAVWCVPEIPLDELKEMELLLDPDADPEAEVSLRVLRHKIKSSLILFLFYCDEIKIPDSVLRAVSLINTYSDHLTTKEKVDGELECILNISSCMRQVVWGLCEDSALSNIDQEFWSAYVEESESYDDGDNYDDDDGDDVNDDVDETNENQCSNYEEVQTSSKHEFCTDKGTHKQKPGGTSMRMKTCLNRSELQGSTDNKYLSIESICDQVGLFAHKLVGRLIEKRLEVEGHNLSVAAKLYLQDGVLFPKNQDPRLQRSTDTDTDALIFTQVIKEVMPSLSQSGMERLLQIFAE